MEKVISYYPTHIEVTPFQAYAEQAGPLLRKLSVWDKPTFSYSFTGYRVDEERDTLLLPGGVDPTLLSSIFPDHQALSYRESLYDDFQKNRAIRVNYGPRDETQKKALEFLLYSKYDPLYSQKYLALQTGQGKTYCAIKAISTSQRRPLILVNREELALQWKQRIVDFTDTNEKNVVILSGKKSIENALKSKTKSKVKFYIGLHRTVGTLAKEEPDTLESFCSNVGIGLKVFDEAHLEWESLLAIDMALKLPSIYLSATPSRSNPAEAAVYGRIFSNVGRFTSTSSRIKSKQEKYHRVVLATYDTKPDIEFKADLEKKSARRGFNVNFYSDYIYNHRYDQFYSTLEQIVTKMSLKDPERPKKTLILVKKIDMVDRLYESFKQLAGDKCKVSRFHSRLTADEKYASFDADLIVSTDASVGTAKDIKNLEIVISTIPTSSAVTTTQMLGRLRELPSGDVYYFDVVDRGLKDCVRQATNRKSKVYLKKAKRIQEINF